MRFLSKIVDETSSILDTGNHSSAYNIKKSKCTFKIVKLFVEVYVDNYLKSLCFVFVNALNDVEILKQWWNRRFTINKKKFDIAWHQRLNITHDRIKRKEMEENKNQNVCKKKPYFSSSFFPTNLSHFWSYYVAFKHFLYNAYLWIMFEKFVSMYYRLPYYITLLYFVILFTHFR